MANKKNTLLIAGLAAGAYAYLRKQENRDKAVAAFNSTKDKVGEFVTQQKQSMDSKRGADPETGDHTIIPDRDTSYYIEEKEMVDEGALTTVQYFNEEKQEEVDEQDNLAYFIEDKEMVDEGALTKVGYENADAQAFDDSEKEKQNSTSYHNEDRDMISEGAGTTVHYYNEKQDADSKKNG